MLLELIANGATYGRKGKSFTLDRAFHHPEKKWDENTFYGGKHAMATHGTGAGNLMDRGKVVRSRGVGWEDEITYNPKHLQVIYRELNLLKKWLELTNQHFPPSWGFGERILDLLMRYLKKGCFHQHHCCLVSKKCRQYEPGPSINDLLENGGLHRTVTGSFDQSSRIQISLAPKNWVHRIGTQGSGKDLALNRALLKFLTLPHLSNEDLWPADGSCHK